MNMQPPGGRQPFGPGGVPNLSGPAERDAALKALVAQQVAQISGNIFTRVVAADLAQSGPESEEVCYRSLARKCEQAAKDYLSGIGLAKFADKPLT